MFSDTTYQYLASKAKGSTSVSKLPECDNSWKSIAEFSSLVKRLCFYFLELNKIKLKFVIFMYTYISKFN